MSDESSIYFFIGGFVVIGVGGWLWSGWLNHQRITGYLEERGARVLAISWKPFGPGWVGEKSDTIYAVRYVDHHGHEHDAHCKTGLFTGVYFTNDHIVRRNPAHPPEVRLEDQVAELERENRRLQEELRRRGG